MKKTAEGQTDKKLLIIPDVHGSTHWKKAIDEITGYDKIIFLGDYVDDWVIPDTIIIQNLNNIIDFKKANPEKVVLLIGNHDNSYITGEHCSGFRPTYENDLIEIFDKNIALFDAVYIEKNWIFSHAGVSQPWLDDNKRLFPSIIEINKAYHSNQYLGFRWVGPDDSSRVSGDVNQFLYELGASPDGFGDNANEGCLWIRPNSLIKNAVKGYNQVVGHTELSNVPHEKKSKNGNRLIFIDNRNHDRLLGLEI